MSTRIIASISSDIGLALARHWAAEGHRVAGTYRTPSEAIAELVDLGVQLIECDFLDTAAVEQTGKELLDRVGSWEALVMAPATLNPIGPFDGCDFAVWDTSIRVNFTSNMQFIHCLLGGREKSANIEPIVLLFAGGGTNGAMPNSKIAQIKMCELLNAEIPDVRFTIVGPGFVDTKIHTEIFEARENAREVYDMVVNRLGNGQDVPMQRVVDCCDWLVNAPREVVGGRNFSCQYDAWGTSELDEMLRQDPNMFMLRRSGNEK